jgi:hypothetical protein
VLHPDSKGNLNWLAGNIGKGIWYLLECWQDFEVLEGKFTPKPVLIKHCQFRTHVQAYPEPAPAATVSYVAVDIIVDDFKF